MKQTSLLETNQKFIQTDILDPGGLPRDPEETHEISDDVHDFPIVLHPTASHGPKNVFRP